MNQRNKIKIHGLLNIFEPVNNKEIENKENIIQVHLPEYGISMISDIKLLGKNEKDNIPLESLFSDLEKNLKNDNKRVYFEFLFIKCIINKNLILINVKSY